MIVGVPKEILPGEHRIALVPGVLPSLAKAGFEILVEAGAGDAAGFPDSAFTEKGARIAPSREALFREAGVVLQVRGLAANPDDGAADLEALREGQILIGFLEPLGGEAAIRFAAEKGVIAFAMELIPRITRAQSMDALSSMATIAGYKAVILAAEALPRMFPMMMTAAGTVAPARVFVMGAGVAGLQALASARRLGAVTQAYDIRPAVREQVESVGARFVVLDLETGESETKGGYAKAMGEEFYRRQRELMTEVISESDVVITTAAIPGKKAPILVTEGMVEAMPSGSVLVDLAAERGGNCELTKPGHTVVHHGVSILGPMNLPSTVPYHASQMYAKNITTLLTHLMPAAKLREDDDEIFVESRVCAGGEVTNPRLRENLGLAQAAPSAGKDE